MANAELKYQQNIADPLGLKLSAFNRSYSAAIVIPAHKEEDTIIECIENIPSYQKGVLAVVVVNGTKASMDADTRCYENLRTQYSATSVLSEHHSNEQRDILHAHRASTPFGDLLLVRALFRKTNVGLARRIGSDLVYRRWREGSIESPHVWWTDADARLPPDYFEQPQNPHRAAAIYPFEHIPVAGFEEAIYAYELRLRLYVEGLRYAGSPVAYHTIGSTMSIGLSAYAAVRGVPCRQAGEDFYLLNKLQKIGSIERCRGKPILLSGRPSDRVPFGTCPTIQKGEPITCYHPNIFQRLKQETQVAEKDAFQTLKYVHAERAKGLPDLSPKEAWHLSKEMLGPDWTADDELLNCLKILRQRERG